MIVSKLTGGLGNQMFQYAIGRNLALKRKSKLVLDISGYRVNEGLTKREFALHDFIINADVSNELEEEKSLLHKVAGKFNPLNRKQLILENELGFDPKILQAPANCILIGYWQSEKYFNDSSAEIRREFEFKPSVKNGLQKLSQKIMESNSVSVHFRRGDYVRNSVINQIHGLCDLNYYKNALDLILQKYSDLKLFVFSDDLNWAKENFKTDCEMNFMDNSGSAISDMYLMSLCKHHIIANSSFSWWGAWLGASPQKIVIAPKMWFKLASRDSSDILPPSWIRL